jgi:hypothetical protein
MENGCALGRVIFLSSVVLLFCLLWKCIISDFELSNHTTVFSAHWKAISAASSRHCELYAFDLLRTAITTSSM